MRRTIGLVLWAILLLGARVWSAETDGKYHIAIVTDSRGSLVNAMRKQDATIQYKAGPKDGTTETLKASDVWPARVAGIPGVEVHYPTKGKRNQVLTATPRILEDDDRVYDLLILQCGNDDYFRPEVNPSRMKQRVEKGEIPAPFVEDLKKREYDIHGSDFEKWAFEEMRKKAKRIIYVGMNLEPFDVRQKEMDRFEKMKVFDAIVGLPMEESWARDKTFDGAHYNAAGHAYVAEHVVPVVEKIMKEAKAAGAK